MTRKSRFSAVFDGLFSNAVLGGEYCRKSAFVWLIHHAAFKPHEVRTRSGVIQIQRGQVVVGRQHLAKEWQWSEKRVRTFLGDLAAAGMLEMGQREGQYANVATICNYDTYQSATTKQADEKANEGPARGQREASEGPTKGHTVPSNTKKETTTTTTASARVDEGVVVVQSPNGSTIDRFALEVALRKAAGSSIGNAPKLNDTSPIVALIEGGFDLKTQILPSIERTAKQKRLTPIGNWSYFAKVILTEVGQHTATKAEAESIVAATADAAKAKAEKVKRDVIIRDIRQMTEKLTLTFGVTDKDKAEYRQSLIKMKTELPPDLLAMLNKYCEDLRLTL